MTFLLDTNVISEPSKKQPNPRVLHWLATQSEESLFLSVLTVGELRRGIRLLDAGKKRRSLLLWLEEDIEQTFAGRILSVDSAVMEHWADLQANLARKGNSLPVIDGLLAATALAYNLTLVTRNTADFVRAGVTLLNPWGSASDKPISP